MNAKPLAKGFPTDVGKLLYDFEHTNSCHFDAFLKVWKENKFAAIYGGRNHEEMVQFTQEMFQLTLDYLESHKGIYKIGSIYLLYALFRNQLLDPPVLIRVQIVQWKNLSMLCDVSVQLNLKHLHYIITYLQKHALLLVGDRELNGPRSYRGKMDQRPAECERPAVVHDMKKRLSQFFDSEEIKSMIEVEKEYEEFIKYDDIKRKPNSNPPEQYQSFLNDVKTLVEDGMYLPRTSRRIRDTIGPRRVELRNTAFSKGYKHRYLYPSDKSGEDPDEPEAKVDYDEVVYRRRRRRSCKRGRTRKFGLVGSRPEEMELLGGLSTMTVETAYEAMKTKYPTKIKRPIGRPGRCEDYLLIGNEYVKREKRVGRPRKLRPEDVLPKKENSSDCDSPPETKKKVKPRKTKKKKNAKSAAGKSSAVKSDVDETKAQPEKSTSDDDEQSESKTDGSYAREGISKPSIKVKDEILCMEDSDSASDDEEGATNEEDVQCDEDSRPATVKHEIVSSEDEMVNSSGLDPYSMLLELNKIVQKGKT